MKITKDDWNTYLKKYTYKFVKVDVACNGDTKDFGVSVTSNNHIFKHFNEAIASKILAAKEKHSLKLKKKEKKKKKIFLFQGIDAGDTKMSFSFEMHEASNFTHWYYVFCTKQLGCMFSKPWTFYLQPRNCAMLNVTAVFSPWQSILVS